MRAIRSVVAVIAGFIAGVTTMLLGMAKGALFTTPAPSVASNGMVPAMPAMEFLLQLVLYAVSGLVAGYVAGRLAPAHGFRHGMAVAALILAISLNDQRNPLTTDHRLQLVVTGAVAISCCLVAARAAERRR